MQKKSSYITLLTVVSCFAVVLLHTNGGFWTFSTGAYWACANVVENIACFAVPCFFMISGATLLDYRERYSLKTYFAKRIQKTVIPFVAWTLVGVLYTMVYLKWITWENITFTYLYNALVKTNVIVIYWFFPSLFSIYLAIPLFAAVEKSARKEIFSYLVILGVVRNVALPFLKNFWLSDLALPLSFDVVVDNLLYVPLGYLLHEYELSKKQRGTIYLLAAAGLLMQIVGTYFASVEAGTVVQTYKGYYNLPCVLYAAGVFTWFRYNGGKIMENIPIQKAVRFFSEYTFGIYLVHIYFVDILERRVNTFTMLYSLGMPFVLIPLCVAVIWVIRKIPVLRRIVP